MNKEELRSVLNSFFSDKVTYTWVQLALLILFTAVAFYLGAYFKTKGTNLATKEDVENLTHKLEAVKTEYLLKLESHKAAAKAAADSALERLKFELQIAASNQSANSAELRTAMRDLIIGMASIVHSMCWLTWDAKTRKRLDKDMVTKYDAEVHALIPTILGNLAMVVLFSPKHAKFSEVVEDIIDVDARIGEAIVGCENDREESLTKFDRLHKDATDIEFSCRKLIDDMSKEALRESEQAVASSGDY